MFFSLSSPKEKIMRAWFNKILTNLESRLVRRFGDLSNYSYTVVDGTEVQMPETDVIVKNTVQYFKEVVSFSWNIDRFYILSFITGAILAPITYLGSLYGIGFIADYVGFKEDYIGKLFEYVGAIILGIFLYQLVKILFEGYIRYRQETVDDIFRFTFQKKDIELLQKLDLGQLENPQFLRLKQALGGAERIFKGVLESSSTLLTTSLQVVTSGFVIIVIDWRFLPVLCIPFLPGLVVQVIFNKVRSKIRFAESEWQRRAEAYYEAAFRGGILLSRLVQGGEYFAKRYLGLSQRVRDTTIALEKKELIVGVCESIFSLVITMGVLYAAFVQAKNLDDYSLAKLLLLFGAITSFMSSVQSFSWRLGHMLERYGFFHMWKIYSSTQPLVREDHLAGETPVSCKNIAFENVCFAYPGNTERILKGLSVDIKEGERVAIVGANGCGKTTALKLLTKTYLAQSGYIFFGKTSIQDVRQKTLLEHVLYLPQGLELFSGLPIWETMSAQPKEELDESLLWECLTFCEVADKVREFKNGLDTLLGSDWEDRADLSTGQHKRLLIASALYRIKRYKGQYDFVIFDEPMANCDQRFRDHFYRSLKTFGCGVIVVAHDPMFLHHFDKVILIEAGVVARVFAGNQVKEYQAMLFSTLSGDL